MRAAIQPIHRAQLVQRVQSVRQQRVGAILVSVRFQRQQVATRRQEFQEMLSTVGAFQRMPTARNGEVFRQRLQQVAMTAREGLGTSQQRDDRLSVREERLHQLLRVAERAHDRGVERERCGMYDAARLRESSDVVELQGEEGDVVGRVFQDERVDGVMETGQFGVGGGRFGSELTTTSIEDGIVAVAPLLSVRAGVGSGDTLRQPLAAVRSHQPAAPSSSPPIKEVVVEAPLPHSAGSVEIVHSLWHGVSVRVSARGAGAAAALRRSCQGIHNLLKTEQVRVSAIEVIEEEL